MTNEVRTLICTRVEDGEPHTQSVVGVCAECGKGVWISNSSPPHDQQLCMQCARDEIDEIEEKGFAENLIIEPLTPEQITDIKRALDREDD